MESTEKLYRTSMSSKDSFLQDYENETITYFNKWRKYKDETGYPLLTGLFQNAMILSQSMLQQEFDSAWSQIVNDLPVKYSEEYIAGIKQLYLQSSEYIKSINETPVTDEEVKALEDRY